MKNGEVRLLVFPLVLVVFLASACKPIARTSDVYEENERKEGMSWQKKVLIVAGAGATIFGGFKLAKYLDRIVGQKIIQNVEAIALSTRPAFKKFKLDYDKLPLYKLTAPDGSEHWLLGTMHTTGLSIKDLPANSRTLKAFDQATTFIIEHEIDSLRSTYLRYKTHKKIMQSMQANFNLREALGNDYMDKLNKELSEIIDKDLANDNPKEIEELVKNLSSIQQMQPAHALSTLNALALQSAFGNPGLMMDTQLLRKARQAKKKVFGLEKTSDTVDAVVKSSNTARPDDPVMIEKLKNFIDAGGVKNHANEYDEMRTNYVNGNLDKINAFMDRVVSDEIKKILLTDRNQAWIRKGTIQKNCKTGQKCMIGVGAAHLDNGESSLVELLTKEGFKVERME